MKLNLKKAMPVLASALLLGSSFAFAISSIDQWKNFGADTAIVIGANATGEDTVGAGDFQAALAGLAAGAEAAGVTGEAKLIEAPGDDLNYGEAIGTIKDTLEKRDLPTILADGRYRENKGNTENDITYTQFLKFRNDTGIIEFTQNTEVPTKPVDTYLHFVDTTGVYAYKYRLVFDNPVEFDPAEVDEDFELTKLKMLGRDYFIVDASVDAANKIDSLTLMGGTLKASQSEYSKQTYPLAGKTYEVEVKIISDAGAGGEGTVLLVINGEETDELVEGDTFTLEDDTRVGILDIIPNEGAERIEGTAEGNDLVTFYLGAEKIVLKQGDEVEINGIAVDGSEVDLQTGAVAGELSEINMWIIPNDDLFLAKGENWTDPILNRFKITYQGLEANTETISVSTSGDDGTLTLKNIVGDELEIPFVLDDATNQTFPGDEFISNINATITQDGSSGTAGSGNLLIANSDSCTGNASVENCEGIKLLVVGTGGEARIIEIEEIDVNNNKIDLVQVSPDSTNKWDDTYTDGVDKEIVLGGLATIKLNINETANKVTATHINTCGSACNAGDFLTDLAGEINIRFDNSTNKSNVYLFNDDGDDLLGAGGPFPVLTFEDDTGGDMIINNDPNNKLNWMTEKKDSDYEVAIDNINWGAIFRFDSENDDDLTIAYPEEEVIHKVYVSEVLANIPELVQVDTGAVVGNLLFLDTELTSELKSKNLVVVGGSAVNRIAAELLGLSYPTYGDSEAWQNATDVTGEGQAIVKLLDNPYATGKQALLVAGWSGSDTRKACKAVTEGISGLVGKTSAKLDTSAATAVVIA